MEHEQYLRENAHLGFNTISEKLGIPKDKLKKMAKDLGIEVYSEVKAFEEGIKRNAHLPLDELSELLNRVPSYVKRVARDLGIDIIEPKKEKKEKVPKEETEDELRRYRRIMKEREERSAKIKANRPKGEYNQSSSPFGLAEKLGVTAKTIKR